MILAYLHPGHVPHEFLDSVLAVTRNPDIVRVSKKSGPGIARARNQIASYFLSTDEEWLLWVDADMVFDGTQVEALRAFDEPFVAAMAVRVDENGNTRPAAVQGIAHGYAPLTYEECSEPLVEVDGVGMAFTLIHRDVYSAIGVRVGHPHIERVKGGVIVGEDVSMCLHAADKGFKPKLATEVHVGHVKSQVMWP